MYEYREFFFKSKNSAVTLFNSTKKSLYGVIQDCENKRLEKIENTILPTDRLIPVNSQEVSLVTAALCPRCDTKQQCTQDDIPEKPEQWQH